MRLTCTHLLSAIPPHAQCPGYHTSPPTTRFPVLYMHDGQNAIDPATSFLSVDWGLDEALLAGLDSGSLREFIAVLVWNTPQRLQEYMPAGVCGFLAVCVGQCMRPVCVSAPIESTVIARNREALS